VSPAGTIACGACGGQTPSGKKFCIHCGSTFREACPACGEPVLPGAKFCAECGTSVSPSSLPASGAAPAEVVAERRLVSVLFADLVGFTTLSERRDPEEVRELLSVYFDRCRALIELYGGTVEKFIGDAVMAVWGSPVAREDDAERSVRAALRLTQAVTLLGEEVGMPSLRVRAGVLTGSAAVERGAEAEGMVLGDTVNTASRLQSIAAPGTVLVDDVTRRASEAAIEYEDAGEHQVKGREQPLRAWTALRVVAGVGGARRSVGLEAPFVGRDAELQTIVDTAQASAAGGHARLTAVVGDAGSGKSRLLWEFFKYLDGLEESRYWHQGRCLSYGEGVSYWALAEMIRARAGITEEEPPDKARQKLRATVETYVTDERERRLVEPRLAHLLRLEERPDADRADLFSGWRLFYERMAAAQPVILAFEDLQWADSGLLEFIDYLLEWSADYPIFVLALGRPELRERRPGWQPLVLDALSPDDVGAILDGLAPGLPQDLIGQIVRRSEGIPLYVVETIRMLQDRGLLVQEGARYIVTGDVSDLAVPETLQALVASRLDGLSAAERSLLQDASVLGHSFVGSAAAALGARAEPEVTRILDGLVRKQVLARDDDPRSPERGQYVFLQALLRTVANGTLSRRARKARHVAAARHLEETWPGETRDIAEVLASHYLEAIRADPDAEDAETLRASACATLANAGRAAASLALGPEAQRYLEQAAELADSDVHRAELLELAGIALRTADDTQGAEERLRRAIELRKRSGAPLEGRAAIVLGSMMRYDGRLEEARELLSPYRDIQGAPPDPVTRAEALAELAGAHIAAGELADCAALIEEALAVLEVQQAWAPLTTALIARSVYLIQSHRYEEAYAVLRHALTLSERHDLPQAALRVHFNLAAVSMEAGRLSDALADVEAGLALARERGDRRWERALLSQEIPLLVLVGRWDEAHELSAGWLSDEIDTDQMATAAFLAPLAIARGDDEMLGRYVSMAEARRGSETMDQRISALLVLARAALEGGELTAVQRLVDEALGLPIVPAEFVEESIELSIQAAVRHGDEPQMVKRAAYLAGLAPGRMTDLLRAASARLAAERAHLRGDPEQADERAFEAERILRTLDVRPRLAQALLERARRSPDSGGLTEARAIYAGLGASRWLERIDQEFGVRA
jgi:class 3 adenylate cyclase/predicted ATPase